MAGKGETCETVRQSCEEYMELDGWRDKGKTFLVTEFLLTKLKSGPKPSLFR